MVVTTLMLRNHTRSRYDLSLTHLERAAWHEAAHAVCARALGLFVARAWIDESGNGQVDVQVDNRQHFAIVALAGRLYERTVLEPQHSDYPFEAYSSSFDLNLAIAEVGENGVFMAEDDCR